MIDVSTQQIAVNTQLRFQSKPQGFQLKPQRGYNNYTLAIMLSILAGIGVSLALIFTAHISGDAIPQWLYDLIFGLLSVSQVVSGTGYSFTGFDILFDEETVFQINSQTLSPKQRFFKFVQRRKFECVGLFIGFLLAIPLTVLLVLKKVSGVAGNFAKFIPIVGPVVEFIQNVSMISGLCSRLGRCSDYVKNNLSDEHFFRHENINYVLSVIAGVILGAIFVGLILGLVGATSAMTFGVALPIWCAKGLFAISTISVCASSSGYVGRVFDFFLGNRAAGMQRRENGSVLENVKKRGSYERKLTVVGVGLGIALGVVLIATGLFTMPFFGVGLPAVAAGFLVMATCISGMGGLFNRIGHAVDKGVAKKQQQLAQKKALAESPVHEPEPERRPSEDPGENNKLLTGENWKGWRTWLANFSGHISAPEKRKQEETYENHDLNSGRRSGDTTNVKTVADACGLRDTGGSRYHFFAKTHRTAISGSHSVGLDASGDKWTGLRQKAEERKKHTAYTYNNDYRARRGGEQIEGVGNGGRRLCYQAAVAA